MDEATHSLPIWPHPLSGDHLAGLGRLVGAKAPLLMLLEALSADGVAIKMIFGPVQRCAGPANSTYLPACPARPHHSLHRFTT